MKRSDFVALPTSTALGVIWDAFPALAAKLEAVLVPKVAMSPKYDTVLFRSDGVQYASECDVSQLRYYLMRSEESAAKGGEWAEKDKKRAVALQYFIDWRLVEPHTRWSGERNREKVTAEPPSSRPKTYPRQAKEAGVPAPKRERKFEDEEPVDDDDVPY